jgi:hypothetical protein
VAAIVSAAPHTGAALTVRSANPPGPHVALMNIPLAFLPTGDSAEGDQHGPPVAVLLVSAAQPAGAHDGSV